jgi:hypothetical protein
MMADRTKKLYFFSHAEGVFRVVPKCIVPYLGIQEKQSAFPSILPECQDNVSFNAELFLAIWAGKINRHGGLLSG